MTVVVAVSTNAFVDRVLAHVSALDPQLEIRRDDAAEAFARAEALVCMRAPTAPLPPMPRLRFAFAPGAGIDGLVACRGLPAGLPLVRVCDPQQAKRMAQYVATMVLAQWRDLDVHRERQRARAWIRDLPADEADAPVAVLGYGMLGRATAHALAALGFAVTAWTRSARKTRDGDVAIASGFAALDALLAASRFVVVLLPLADETRGLLDRARIANLRRDAYIVNAARAAIIDEGALLDALDQKRIGGAALDVFWTEPLPADSRWWKARNATLTPHVAAFPRPEFVARAFVDALRRAQAGVPLDNVAGFAR